MNFPITLAALALATFLAWSNNIATGVPGWFIAGSTPDAYEAGVVPAGGALRNPVVFFRSLTATPRGFGTLMQQFSAKQYLGQRVRFSARVRSESLRLGAGLWLRVNDGQNRVLAFDNMYARRIKGTTDWQYYDVVLDVASEATTIALGVLVTSSGTVWLDGVRFEAVSLDTPLTSIPEVEYAMDPKTFPIGPRNLDFSQHDAR